MCQGNHGYRSGRQQKRAAVGSLRALPSAHTLQVVSSNWSVGAGGGLDHVLLFAAAAEITMTYWLIFVP